MHLLFAFVAKSSGTLRNSTLSTCFVMMLQMSEHHTITSLERGRRVFAIRKLLEALKIEHYSLTFAMCN